MEDTLVNSIGNIYSVAISDFPFNASLGLYYQYYRVKNGVQYRETYFNFAYTGDEQPLAERRYIPFTGATDGGTADVNDNVHQQLMKEDNQHSEILIRLVKQ